MLQRMLNRGGRSMFLTTAVLLTVTCPTASVASDVSYVMPDGKKFRLTRSTTEYGLLFRSGEEATACTERFVAQGLGTVQPFELRPETPVRLFKVPQVSEARRAALLADPVLLDARPVYRFDGEPTPVISSGTMVVKLRPDLTDQERRALWREFDTIEVRVMRGLHDVYVVEPAGIDQDEVARAEQLAADDRTLWSTPNFRRAMRTLQSAPSDEFFHLQWHLNNTGQTEGTDDADIDALEAWSTSTGSSILFGMFDDSCDVDHEDLVDNYIGIGQDVVVPFFDDGNKDPRPKFFFDAHGTAVMGLAVAAANSVGVRGVAYDAKFTASRGLLNFPTDDEIASAFTFALEQNVDVHINSWGPIGRFPDPPILADAFETAFREGRDPDGPGGIAPRGMVIVFAAGNGNAQNDIGFAISSLPSVIAVGATTFDDLRSGFSNFGNQLSVMAPGGGDPSFGITTTDTEDGIDKVAQGYNVGGTAVDPESGFQFGPDIDPDGGYTGFFGGTSAACPIVAGVAGLVLSANPELTATDVRIILEHTTDQINPVEAQYGEVTSRSFKYGYGRVNANKAVLAAVDAVSNGGLTWPGTPADLNVDTTVLTWIAGAETDEFIVVQRNDVLNFIPQEGSCYDEDQEGCSGQTIEALPDGAAVLDVGCGIDCEAGTDQSVNFTRPTLGTMVLAVYGRNATTGRYSFGVSAKVQSTQPPAVTISVSPLEGFSPLVVNFAGNALSELTIDENATEWDFDIDDDITADARTRNAQNTYTVDPGVTKIFVARLTMRDDEGNAGSAQVAIRVDGPARPDSGDGIGTSDLKIIAGVPGTSGSDNDTGPSPFEVILSLDTAGLTGTFQSVVWDLGDGTRATSLAVPHTYINESDTDLRLTIVATITTATSSGTIVSSSAQRAITVQPGIAVVDPGEPNLPGTSPIGDGGRATACGVISAIPLLFTLFSLMWLRRRSG